MNSTSPRWGLLALGLALLAIALGAGGLSLTLNFLYGMRKGGLEYAAAFVLADMGKIFIPIAATILGWNRQLKIVVVLCAIASVWCALSMYADRVSRQITSATVSAQQYNGAAADLVRMRRELASIRETGQAADLEKLAEQASARAATEQKRRGGPNIRCKACEKWRTQAATFTERASVAKRRQQLEAAIASAKNEAKASKPVEADGMAAFITANFGGQTSSTARIIAMGVALLLIMLIESLVYVSIQATQLIATAMRGSGKSKLKAAPQKASASFEPAIEPSRTGRKAAVTRDEALALLRSHARTAGGAVFASKAAIATALGVSRTTLTDRKRGWLAHWERTGEVRLTRTSGGIAVSVEQKVAA